MPKKRKSKHDKRSRKQKARARQRARPELPDLERARELLTHGRIEEAVGLLEGAAERRPDDWRVHRSLGEALMEDGRLEEAELALRQSLKLHANDAVSHVRLGDVLSALGRGDEASAAQRRALVLRPTFGLAWLRLVQAKRYRDPHNEDVSRLLTLAQQGDVHPIDREGMSFALGKIYDDLGEPDKAFVHVSRANAIHRERQPFAIASVLALVDRIIAVCDAGLFARTEGWGSSTETPVFIVGVPRCGSTLVEQIISSHPRAYGVGELRTLVRMTADLPQTIGASAPYPDALRALEREHVSPLADAYLKRLGRDAPPDVLRICDKMLSHTMLIGLIAILFPKARIIYCERHPMAIALSMYMHSFSGTGAGFAYDLEHIGAYLRATAKVMAHWKRVAPIPITTVRYEALVENPEQGIRALLEAVDLPWDSACLEFYKAKRQVRTVSEWQVRQPIHKSSVARWRRYERHLAPVLKYFG